MVRCAEAGRRGRLPPRKSPSPHLGGKNEVSLTKVRADRQTVAFLIHCGRRRSVAVVGAGPGRKPRSQAEGNHLKMTDKRVSFTLESTLDSVNLAEEKTEKVAAEMGFSEEDCHRLAMSVREAMVNAVLHGNAYDPKKRVYVVFENNGTKLAITITDEGKGLEASELPDPLAPENLLKQSGRGIFLMRSFMDDVQIRNLRPGTEVKLIKTIGTDTEESEEQKR